MVRMLELLDSFFSSLENKGIDYGLETIMSITGNVDKLKSLKMNTKLLIVKALDVEEQLKNAELSGRKKRKREVAAWLKEVKDIENEFVIISNEEQEEGFVSRFLGGDQTMGLNAIVTRLLEQSQHFGELLLDNYETKGMPLLTSVMVGKAFDKKLNEILEYLVADEVKSIGIYGMGGVGKTTLAKHIHNRLLNATQYSVYWITVSQEFSIKKLQDDIAKLMGLNLSHEENEDRRAAMLNRAISRVKKCVLILDDVWEDIDFEKIGDPLLVEGCRMIITTRSIEVCRKVGCQEKIEVKPLERDEAWNLFKTNLGHFMELGPELQEIARSVAKQCDGLPLGLVTLAKTMRGVTSIHEWENALAELKTSCTTLLNNMEEKVFGVLQYSYNRLDPKLQPCLLYCCLYPEDHSIPRFDLISRFISEGLMDKRKSRSSQFVLGNAILNKLVNHCLLEGKVGSKFVKMHDLVRDMALKIGRKNQKFMVLAGLSLENTDIPNEKEWSENLEKVSLMRNKITKFPLKMSPNCPRLTTLLLNGNCCLDFMPESFFVHMKSLLVLDLSYTSMKELPNTLSDLESLNALILHNCKELMYVPCLGKLTALTELDLSFTGVEKLPQGMECLVSLKAFYSNKMSNLQMLPTSLLHEFPNFRYIQCLVLSNWMKMKIEEIEQMKDLEVFVGAFKNVCDFNQFSKFREHFRCLQFYSVVVGKHLEEFFSERIGFRSVVVSKYLEAYFEERIDYRKVYVGECNFKREEGEESIILPQDIEQLEIRDCHGLSIVFLDCFPLINIPRSLKHLTISGCKETEFILKANDPMMVGEQHSLISLSLKKLPNLVSVINWKVFGTAVMTPSPLLKLSLFFSLKHLLIFKCHKIKKPGLPLACFHNIESITVSECEEIEEIIEVADNQSGGDIISLPNLSFLYFASLPNLKSICNNGATMSCKSIETIMLKKCPNMKKLPLFLPSSQDKQISYPPPALKEIEIHEEDKEWWESLVWKQVSHKNALQPFVKFSSGYGFLIL